MVRWLRWHCPPDTGFEIRALAVWGRARYFSVTEASHNTDFHTWMGKKHFCFFQTAETGNRTPNSGVKGSSANHYPRAPALNVQSVHIDLSRYVISHSFSCEVETTQPTSHTSWHEILRQCCFNAGPQWTSIKTTLAHSILVTRITGAREVTTLHLFYTWYMSS